MFKFAENRNGNELKLTGQGALDEEAVLPKLDLKGVDALIFDLSQVEAVNSCGLRTWLSWLPQNSQNKKIQFSNLPKIFITQANLFLGVVPEGSSVKEIEIPYVCDHCGHSFSIYHEVVPEISNNIEEEIPCQKCSKLAEVDVIIQNYFNFLSKL